MVRTLPEPVALTGSLHRQIYDRARDSAGPEPGVTGLCEAGVDLQGLVAA